MSVATQSHLYDARLYIWALICFQEAVRDRIWAIKAVGKLPRRE